MLQHAGLSRRDDAMLRRPGLQQLTHDCWVGVPSPAPGAPTMRSHSTTEALKSRSAASSAAGSPAFACGARCHPLPSGTEETVCAQLAAAQASHV